MQAKVSSNRSVLTQYPVLSWGPVSGGNQGVTDMLRAWADIQQGPTNT